MIFDSLLGLFSVDMGIDLGTATSLVYVAGRGIVLMEPSFVAVKKGTTRVLLNGQAVGTRAKEMLDVAPGNIAVIRPMKDGVISDFDIAQAMLSYFISKVHNRRWGYKPRVVIAVPSGITAVERRAVIDSVLRAGSRKVYLIDEPMAAAIGAGLPVGDPIGSLIVDIGGGTTEVAVVSLGGIVNKSSVRVAGDEMDEAIITHMKRNYNLDIGHRTAEEIKIEIGSAYPLEKELTREVRGRDSIKGLPKKEMVSSEEIREALSEPVEAIAEAVRRTLERTPPELAADLVDRGIVLAGGGSIIRGLEKVLNQETGLPVRRADDPMTCVVRGTGEVLERLDDYKTTLEQGDEGG